jgi:hypothetical protein
LDNMSNNILDNKFQTAAMLSELIIKNEEYDQHSAVRRYLDRLGFLHSGIGVPYYIDDDNNMITNHTNDIERLCKKYDIDVESLKSFNDQEVRVYYKNYGLLVLYNEVYVKPPVRQLVFTEFYQ